LSSENTGTLVILSLKNESGMHLTQDNLFYTKEHDWIGFSGAIAYIGATRFKLTGITGIDDISLFGFKTGDLIEQGALLLHIHYREYIIPVNAPVTCTLLRLNPIIDNGSWEFITEDPEGEGWLFKVETRLQDNGHLLQPAVYKTRLSFTSVTQS
jgi:glycine cleavage system H protein